jgi:hypothetical protein
LQRRACSELFHIHLNFGCVSVMEKAGRPIFIPVGEELRCQEFPEPPPPSVGLFVSARTKRRTFAETERSDRLNMPFWTAFRPPCRVALFNREPTMNPRVKVHDGHTPAALAYDGCINI